MMETIRLSMHRNLDRGGVWLDAKPAMRRVGVHFHEGVWALVEMYRPQSPFDCLRKRIGDEFDAMVSYRGRRRIVVVPLSLLPPRGWQTLWKRKFADSKEFYEWFRGLTMHSYGGVLYVLPRGRGFMLLGDLEPVPFLQIPESMWPLIVKARELGVRFTYDGASHPLGGSVPPIPSRHSGNWNKLYHRHS